MFRPLLRATRVQERGVAAQQEARLQKEVADESRVKDQIREVTTRVAGGEAETAALPKGNYVN